MKRLIYGFLPVFILFFSLLIKTAVGDTMDYKVPDSDKQAWQNIKSWIDKEYQVCKEHCGASQQCIKSCKKNHLNRLNKEYKQFMHEKN